MNFKIQLFIGMLIIGIGLAKTINTGNIGKPHFNSNISEHPKHHGHTLKRDAKDQTAVEDKTGQSNPHIYYQTHHPQQSQPEQQYQTGFVPITQYYTSAAISPQVQYKDDFDVQYMKNDNGVELNNYPTNGGEGYQTLAYSANQPLQGKLASIIQLMSQQLAPLQYTYEPIVPQQQQQSYEQPKMQNVAIAYPSGYRQPQSAYVQAPNANPARSYAYPAHALQYTIVTPVPNLKSNSYSSSNPQASATKLFLTSPSQFAKYQFSQPQQQPSLNAQYPSNLIYSSPQSANAATYHPLTASQYDFDDKPQVYYSNPNKAAYQQLSNFQYKQGPQPNNHIGPISFNRFSARPPSLSGQSKGPSAEPPVYATPPSQKSQLTDNTPSSGKLIYSYGPHLLHSDKVSLHQPQQSPH